jgi:hypothetical protein
MRVTLLEYSPVSLEGSILNDRLHVSPNLRLAGGKPCAEISMPENEIFFVLQGYLMSLWYKVQSCSTSNLTPFLLQPTLGTLPELENIGTSLSFVGRFVPIEFELKR